MSSSSCSSTDSSDLQRNGFIVVPEVLRAAELVDVLAAAIPHSGQRTRRGAGRRDLLAEPWVQRIAASNAVRQLVVLQLGPRAFPVRGLWFDKTAEANWIVPWHQDSVVVVRRRLDVPGFNGWSEKAGAVHVHAPTEVLAAMLTVRLHLDPCGPENGPLRVRVGSHLAGRLDDAGLAAALEAFEEVTCLVPAGGALVMRPLLLHASSRCVQPTHRRVLHLEFAAQELPGGLEWSVERGQ